MTRSANYPMLDRLGFWSSDNEITCVADYVDSTRDQWASWAPTELRKLHREAYEIVIDEHRRQLQAHEAFDAGDSDAFFNALTS